MAGLTVLGIGNILMRDDGIGVRLMEAVRDSRPWPAEVEFVDGGAGGLALLDIIETAKMLVVFDAADMNLPPGESRLIQPDQLEDHPDPDRLSLHQMTFAQTLELCGRFLKKPPTVILAIQPKTVDYGRQIDREILDRWDSLVKFAADLVQSYLNRHDESDFNSDSKNPLRKG